MDDYAVKNSAFMLPGSAVVIVVFFFLSLSLLLCSVLKITTRFLLTK